MLHSSSSLSIVNVAQNIYHVLRLHCKSPYTAPSQKNYMVAVGSWRGMGKHTPGLCFPAVGSFISLKKTSTAAVGVKGISSLQCFPRARLELPAAAP